jgi:hypothetical protein
MYKSFKYLDVATDHIYISRDVVFDETMFPFTTLHPNAAARLRSEILLLPDTLKNPSSTSGVNDVTDHSVIFPNLTTSEPMDADTGADLVVINPGDILTRHLMGHLGKHSRYRTAMFPSVQHMVHAAPAGEHLVHAVLAAPAHGACGTYLHEHSVHAHAVPAAQAGGTHLPLQQHSAHGPCIIGFRGTRCPLASASTLASDKLCRARGACSRSGGRRSCYDCDDRCSWIDHYITCA